MILIFAVTLHKSNLNNLDLDTQALGQLSSNTLHNFKTGTHFLIQFTK